MEKLNLGTKPFLMSMPMVFADSYYHPRQPLMVTRNFRGQSLT
ncbi:hypothetical protein MASR2M79_21500 [Aminivibrio sp.]